MSVIIPPHPTPPVTDDERAVPVSAGQQERWWGCRACVCTGKWTLLSHPTPPSGSYLACGGKQNQSLVAVRTFKNLTAASDWFWRVLQESYCCKWLVLTAASDWNHTAASDRILLPQVTVEPMIFLGIGFHGSLQGHTSTMLRGPVDVESRFNMVQHILSPSKSH